MSHLIPEEARLRRTAEVLQEVRDERRRQTTLWGHQRHPDGESRPDDNGAALWGKQVCDLAAKSGGLTWRHILSEEYLEAMEAIGHEANLRAELIQMAAVCCAWVEAIDNRCYGEVCESNITCRCGEEKP